MKRLIIFLLLFAAIKVAGQTTGYLRFDTVRIYKQNGTCELYLINSTKDSLGLLTNIGGGLTRFLKSRAINDSTIVVGLDTLVIRGATGGSASTDTTIVEKPLIVRTGSNDTLTLQYHDGLTINNDSTLVVSLRWIDSVRRTNPYFYRAVSILYNSGLIVIGNSISQSGTSPYQTWADMLRKVIGGDYNNYSIPGGDLQILGDMLRNDRLPFNRTQAAIYNNGVNEIRFNMTAGTREYMKASIRSFLVNAFKAQLVNASAMTQVAGTWSAYNGLTSSQASKTNGMVTVDSLAELSFTVRDNQPGLFVVFMTNPEYDTHNWSDSVQILRSGGTEVIATISVNKKGHKRNNPYVVWLPNTNVFSTIRIKNLSSDTLIVDYAGTTALNNNLSPALVAEITHVATAALQPGIPHSWWDTVNADIRSVIEDEFYRYGYPAVTIDVNAELEYDNSVFFHELLTTPTSAIHPSTYAHANAILPQALRKIVLRASEKKQVLITGDVSLYNVPTTMMGQEMDIYLSPISQNSQLNLAADSINFFFGQKMRIFNINTNATFNWNAVFWTYREPNGSTGTSFPNLTITDIVYSREGWRVANRYGVDSLRVSNDTLYATISGKQLPPVVLPGGGSSGTAGADGYLQYDSSGFHGARSAYRVDNTSLKLFAGDTLSTGRLVADQIRPLTTNTFGVRSISGNPISVALQNNIGTNELTLAVDGSTNGTVTGIGQLTLLSGSGQNLRLFAGSAPAILNANGRFSINESTALYRFHSYENAATQTAATSSVYGLNQATHNTTSGQIIGSGVFGDARGSRSSGGNDYINAAIRGLASGGQQNLFLYGEVNSAATNAAVPFARYLLNTTGTAAAGLGAQFEAGIENASGTNVIGWRKRIIGATLTAGSESFDAAYDLISAGSLAEKFRLFANGTGRFSGGLQLGALSNGAGGTDSVLVINNTEVKKVAASSLGGGISGLTAGRVTLSTGSTSIGDDANLLYSSSNAGTLSLGTSATRGHFNLGGARNYDGTNSTTAWGLGMYSSATTYTDNVTAASGSTNFSEHFLEAPTIAASNSSVTTVTPVTLRIEAPVAGTNVTITGIPFSIASFGPVWINGAVKTVIGAAAHNSTADYSDDILTCDATSVNFNVNLPSAATYSGVSFTFKRIDGSGNTCTVSRSGSDTIDGATSYSLTAQYKYVKVVSDGTNWLVIANN